MAIFHTCILDCRIYFTVVGLLLYIQQQTDVVFSMMFLYTVLQQIQLLALLDYIYIVVVLVVVSVTVMLVGGVRSERVLRRHAGMGRARCA